MSLGWEDVYSLQDWVLERLREVDHGFYLTGGTALSRDYYQHRYSGGLDFVVNDREEFELWRDRCLNTLRDACRAAGLGFEIVLREARFGRGVVQGPASLKLEFINHVPFRVGVPIRHPELGPLDTKENILANKVTALVDRGDPKDVADVYWLCCKDDLDLEEALGNAEGKAAGIFPPLMAKRLMEAAEAGLPLVHWVSSPQEAEFIRGLRQLAESLLKL